MSADNEAPFEHDNSTEDDDCFSFDGFDETETIYKLLSKTIDETDEDDESDKEYLPKEDEIIQMIKEEEEDEELNSDDDDDDDLPENIIGFSQKLAFFLEFVLGTKNMPYYENIECLVHYYDKSDKNWINPIVYGCYNHDFNSKSHQILERYLQDDHAFDSNLKNYKCLKVVSFYFIPELQNEFLDYIDVFMCRLFNILDGDEHSCESHFPNDEEDETIHEISLNVIMQLFDVFKEDMLPHCDELLEKLIENYKKFPQAKLCQTFFEIFRDFGSELMEWSETVIQVMEEIVFGKEYEYDEQSIIYCLCFFYVCFDLDIQLVFERKNVIIQLLNPSPFGSVENITTYYKLIMIEKLLTNCHKKIFLSLDSNEISEIIRVGCESQIVETKEAASDIKLMFERHKAESIKFCLLNGYSKQF